MKKKLVKEFVSLERDISAEKGEFSLFALFHREEALYDKWDLVIAAPWIKAERMENRRYFVDQLKARLGPKEMMTISRIALINNDDLRLEDIYEDVEVEHGIVEVVFRTFFDMDIKHAYIITSKRENALANTAMT